jgi:hypothetical protein
MNKLLLIALLFLTAIAAIAADLTGTWTAAVDIGVGTGTATFNFKQDGEKLSGTYTGTFGTSQLTGTVKGNNAEWSFDADQVGAVSYKGTIDGSKMKGSVQYGSVGSGTFTAEKK